MSRVEGVGWRGVRCDAIEPSIRAAAYPVHRGTLLSIGPKEALLWMHGSIRGISSNNFFQGGRGTPQPVRLIRHAGHGSWNDSASAILALSKMDWNNDSLYNPLPVTLGYVKVLARIMKRIPALGSTPYQFRFFM